MPDIRLVALDLDGTGRYEIDTGCGFLNHMLELFARHGRFDLVLTCHGDVQVDYHHTTEDVGIALGQAFARALGDMRGIQRYGSFYLPMDEALILCAVDLSGLVLFLTGQCLQLLTHSSDPAVLYKNLKRSSFGVHSIYKQHRSSLLICVCLVRLSGLRAKKNFSPQREKLILQKKETTNPRQNRMRTACSVWCTSRFSAWCCLLL